MQFWEKLQLVLSRDVKCPQSLKRMIQSHGDCISAELTDNDKAVRQTVLIVKDGWRRTAKAVTAVAMKCPVISLPDITALYTTDGNAQENRLELFWSYSQKRLEKELPCLKGRHFLHPDAKVVSDWKLLVEYLGATLTTKQPCTRKNSSVAKDKTTTEVFSVEWLINAVL